MPHRKQTTSIKQKSAARSPGKAPGGKARRNSPTKRQALTKHWSQHRRGWLGALSVLAVGGVAALLMAVLLASGNRASGTARQAHQAGGSSTLQLTTGTPGAQPTMPLGIFALGAAGGGPPPISEEVMRPTNMARLRHDNLIISVYAGSMTRSPQTGALLVLQEDMVTGQETTHLYQTPRPVGALTITAIQGMVLSLSSAAGPGTFDLTTARFQF